MVEEVDDFLVSDLAGQFVDIVATVNQLTDVALTSLKRVCAATTPSRPLLAAAAVGVLMLRGFGMKS